MSTNPKLLIQQKMDAFDRRWRWLKFWEYFFTAGALFCLLWLGLELCAFHGFVTTSWFFFLFTGLFAVSAVIVFLGIAAIVIARETRRTWLADQIEQGSTRLLDRLNTLVFLEGLRRPYAFALKRRIEFQAAQIFEKNPAVVHFSPRRAWVCFGIFAFLLAGIIFFDAHYHPFAKLTKSSPNVSTAKNDTPFELVPGNVNDSKNVSKPWGEVRIVIPGRDIKVTKIDVVQLQIEMAASGKLQNPAWVTSINGGPEVQHTLPPSTEPQYAVYQPLVYLDELKVSDWDVVSYYAKVETPDPAEYASQIYFIEIRPFREDILKQTGGEKGSHARDLLNELNDLITRQTSMLQQTHQYQQTTYPTAEMRKQDDKKLTDTEKGLSASADHLYGKLVSENENAPIGDILDHLTQAEQQMDKATENLGEDVIPEAKQREQGALTELVACRKSFLKVISQNPDAFGGSSSGEGDQTPIASAQDSLKALSQVTEMHDRDEAALKSLHDLTQQEQLMAQKVSAHNDADNTKWANEQSKLKSQIEKLMQNNPDLFRAADSEKASLESDMGNAINSLKSNNLYQGAHYLTHAAGDMNDLEKAVQKNHQLQKLAEAYKLKKIIDQNMQQLGQEKNKPGSLSPQDIKDISDSAKRSTGTLKELTDTPNHGGFGPGLSQALSPENQQALQQALDQLGKSTPGPGSQGAAGAAQGNLAKVSQAFEQDQPRLAKQSPDQNHSQNPPDDALDEAEQELQRLILAEQKKQPPSNEEQNKAQGEIFGDLEDALSKKNTPEAAALLAQVKDMEKQKTSMPFSAPELKKLLDKIEITSAEAKDPNKDKPPGSEITVIDSAKFPASYRDRIRTYYEQLSNQPR